MCIRDRPLTYTAGNFVIHYLPMCHLALWPNFKDWSPKYVQEMAALAAGPLTLYAISFNPNTIYECTKTSHALSTLILLLLPVLMFSGALFIDLQEGSEDRALKTYTEKKNTLKGR